MADYEMVIGLEVHVELDTRSKIFCACPTSFAAEPNTQCCPVCMGLPGSLPVLNRRVVELAVSAGLAANCEIARFSRLDRKHYFYPDLPKAYQISQFDLPLCAHGFVQLGEKRVGITRIHIEEDAGKLVHTPSGETLIDFNRCGVPLIEIVSEPDMRSAREAREYLSALRAILVAAGVSQCRMEEGSMRCDVNISVRFPGQELGVRTEIKNLNSFASVERAIEAEYARQSAVLRAGGTVEQETRRFDPESGQTFPMRRKENADDYRYFPDPDLPPVALSEAWIDSAPRVAARIAGRAPRAAGIGATALRRARPAPWPPRPRCAGALRRRGSARRRAGRSSAWLSPASPATRRTPPPPLKPSRRWRKCSTRARSAPAARQRHWKRIWKAARAHRGREAPEPGADFRSRGAFAHRAGRAC